MSLQVMYWNDVSMQVLQQYYLSLNNCSNVCAYTQVQIDGAVL